MAATLAIRGTSKPSATTLTEIYQCTNQASVSLFVCNQSGADVTYRLALTGGASPAADEYIAYDAPLTANETIQYTGIALAAGEAIWVYSSAGDISYVATGTEEA